jgi:hypothetical protein
MSTIKGTGGLGADSLYDFSWSGFVVSGDLGTVVTIPAHVRELTIQATGTFTGALAIQLQGANDGSTFVQLKDTSGTAISLTDTSIIRFSNPPAQIKPVATAGGGGALANVFIHGAVVD